MGVGRRAVAEQLGVRDRAARLGDLGRLEHEQRGALAHDEPVATRVERPLGRPGLVVVAGRQRPDDVERTERERAERDLARHRRSPRRPDPRAGRRAPRRARPPPTRTSWRSTGSGRGRRGRCRGWPAPRRRRRPARGSARPGGSRARGSARAAPRRRRCHRAPSRDRSRSAAGAAPPSLARRQAGVVEREAAGDQPELAEPVELAGRLGRHPGERVEVVDLGRDLRAERARVEAVDPLDRRAAGAQPGPERVATGADRGDDPEPGDPDRRRSVMSVDPSAWRTAVAAASASASASALNVPSVRPAIGRVKSRSTNGGEDRDPRPEVVLDRDARPVVAGRLDPPGHVHPAGRPGDVDGSAGAASRARSRCAPAR